jgi:hypothetical protein
MHPKRDRSHNSHSLVSRELITFIRSLLCPPFGIGAVCEKFQPPSWESDGWARRLNICLLMPVLFLLVIGLEAPVASAEIEFAPTLRYDLNTSPAQQYAGGTIWQGLTSTDLNGDGRPDVAVNTVDGVAVLLNTGSGTLALSVKYALRDGPPHTTLIAEDLNGDGRPELIASGWFLSNTRFAVLMNKGDGTFATPAYYSGGAGGSLAFGNFFGDGRTHLALLGGTNIIIYRSNGDGTFTAGPSMDLLRERAGALTASDLNNDGLTDLITTLGLSPISVLINLGNGTFSEPTSYPTSRTGVLVAADVDNDGDADLITPMIDTAQVGVMLNSGGGVFATQVFYATGLVGGTTAVSALDVDGDGYLDLATLDLGDTVLGTDTGHIAVLRNNRNGTFAAPVDLLTGGRPFSGSIIFTDLDGDGRSDLVASYYQQNPSQTYIQVIRNLTPQVSNTLRIDRTLPNRGGNAGMVTVSIFGASFQTGARVKLTATGQPDILGSDTVLDSGNLLRTRFNLSGANTGVRNVVVTNSDTNIARLTGAFTIEQGGAPQLSGTIIGLSRLRLGRGTVFYAVLRNDGLIDTDLVAVTLETEGAPQLFTAITKEKSSRFAEQVLRPPDSTWWVRVGALSTRVIPISIKFDVPLCFNSQLKRLKVFEDDCASIIARWNSLREYLGYLYTQRISNYSALIDKIRERKCYDPVEGKETSNCDNLLARDGALSSEINQVKGGLDDICTLAKARGCGGEGDCDLPRILKFVDVVINSLIAEIKRLRGLTGRDQTLEIINRIDSELKALSPVTISLIPCSGCRPPQDLSELLDEHNFCVRTSWVRVSPNVGQKNRLNKV